MDDVFDSCRSSLRDCYPFAAEEAIVHCEIITMCHCLLFRPSERCAEGVRPGSTDGVMFEVMCIMKIDGRLNEGSQSSMTMYIEGKAFCVCAEYNNAQMLK